VAFLGGVTVLNEVMFDLAFVVVNCVLIFTGGLVSLVILAVAVLSGTAPVATVGLVTVGSVVAFILFTDVKSVDFNEVKDAVIVVDEPVVTVLFSANKTRSTVECFTW